MAVLFLGSSVTYGSATNGYSFVEEVAKRTGCKYRKEAVNGTTLAVRADDGDSSYLARLKKYDENEKVSALIVQLSTNDATQNVPLGNLNDGGKDDGKTVIGAIEAIISYARKTWGCAVAFYTNPRFGNANYEKMIAALYEVQKSMPIEIIDFYHEDLGEETLSYYMSDAIHPNERGYRRMSEAFIDFLRKTGH